jgi:hypothetical protein
LKSLNAVKQTAALHRVALLFPIDRPLKTETMKVIEYRITFLHQRTLYIMVVPSHKGKEGAKAIILSAYNCSRAAIIRVEELKSL